MLGSVGVEQHSLALVYCCPVGKALHVCPINLRKVRWKERGRERERKQAI